MTKSQEELYYKALLTLLRKLEEIKPGLGNTMPVVHEAIGYIKGIVGQVEIEQQNFSKKH